MHLVALLSHDNALVQALHSFQSPGARYYVHPLPDQQVEQVLGSLAALDFAGALLLDEADQVAAVPLLRQRSLEAQEVGAADTVTVTSGGLVGEYNLGRSVGAVLRSARWDGRGARAVILGSNRASRSVAHELSSMGIGSLTILAADRPSAERSLPKLAATTEVVARSYGDPLSLRFMESADLLVRTDSEAEVPVEVLGPHLTLVDLDETPVSRVRQQALTSGALSFNCRDVQAQLLALSLSHILGGRIEASWLLQLLHDL